MISAIFIQEVKDKKMAIATKTTDTMLTDQQIAQSMGRPEKIVNQAEQGETRQASQEKQTRTKARSPNRKFPNPTPRFSISLQALKKLKLVAVAYSNVEREFFPTEGAYHAEKEVEERAAQVLQVMVEMGIPGKLYSADEHFITNLLVDRPDLVLNLVDTLRGKDALQTSVPGALELVEIPYTGADMRGLVIGNDRNLFKQILRANAIPTPDFQFIQRSGTKVNPDLGLPLIVKLNEGGGSVGIDNNAVKETLEAAQNQVNELISTYHIPVIVERFIDGPEITAVVFEDSRRKHVFLGQKTFGMRPDGKHEFTSLESYDNPNSYHYAPLQDPDLVKKIEQYVTRVFSILHNKDYSKYDIRVDEKTGTPYFTDCNPNTAFGPSQGLPFTEVLATLYGVKFEKVLAALLSKYAKKIKTRS
jgi:D-alanine-D-alanine ligase